MGSLERTPYVDMPDQQHKCRGRTSLGGTHENLLTGLALLTFFYLVRKKGHLSSRVGLTSELLSCT